MFHYVAGATACLAGAAALAGWALDVGVLKSIRPGWVTVKPNTAIALALLGVAFLLTSRPPQDRNAEPSTWRSVLGSACALVAGLIGLLSLSEYAFNRNLGIDQWFFVEPPGAAGTSHPGRMAPDSAACFLMLAIALWLTRRPRERSGEPITAAVLGTVVAAAGLSAVLIQFTPTLGTRGWWGLTMMAVPTAIAVAMLGISIALQAWQRDVSIWSLSLRLSVAFLVGLAVLVFIGLNTSRSIARMTEVNLRVTHAARIQQTTSRILAEVAAAQANTRGYVITGETRYRDAQRELVARCRAELEALRQLTSGDPEDRAHSALLEGRAEDALTWFSLVGTFERTSPDDAERLQMVDRGEELVESVRQAIESRESLTRKRLDERERESSRASRFTHAISFGGTVVGLIVFLSVLIALNRAFEERRQAELALEQSNATLEEQVAQRVVQLEAANRELEAFSYSVSHDLRAPLRSIDGWSHALLEDFGDRLGEQSLTYLNRIRSETRHMGELIDDMLALARLTVAPLHKERVDLSAMARSIAARLRERDPHHEPEFRIRDGLFAFCDPHLVDAALSNLLANSFKFTGRTPGAHIELGETETGGGRAFFVRDNGAGFDMAHANQLFKAFQRLHRASEFPGTGVGLATVERVIKRHGGRVWAAAEVNRGATFFFTLEEEP